MIQVVTLLLVLQLAGEALAEGLGLVLPGPVIGMVLLFLGLMLRDRLADTRPTEVLDSTVRGLLNHLSLLFVPAGVGVIVHLDLVQAAWLPIFAAVLASTLRTIAVTVLVASRLDRRRGDGRPGNE